MRPFLSRIFSFKILLCLFIFNQKTYANTSAPETLKTINTSHNQESKFNLEAGTMAFGGSFSNTTIISRMGVVRNSLSLKFEGSYFILNNLEAGGSLDLGGLLGTNDTEGRKLPRLRTEIGLTAKYYYYWIVDRFPLYSGISYLFSFQNTADVFRNVVEIPLVGCLFPLASNIALDFSLPFRFTFSPDMFESAEFPRIALGIKLTF